MNHKRKLFFTLVSLILAMNLAACAENTAEGSGEATGQVSSSAGIQGPASGQEPEPEEEGVLRVCVSSTPNTLDPTFNNAMDISTILLHLFEGLYSLDQEDIPRPAQAESCDISPDGKTYTFHLREGLAWSDGSPLTAGDYVYSWQRLADPASGTSTSYLLAGVAGYQEVQESGDPQKLQVSAPDDRTFVVQLNAPAAYFLDLVSSGYFLPVQQKTIAENGEQWALSPDTYVGNGPYRLKEWVPDSHILMEKNPAYWNAQAIGPDSIEFMLTASDTSQLAAFTSGELDFVDSVPVNEIPRLAQEGKLQTVPLLSTYYISFNVEKAPFDNLLVRKAFTLALDRGWLCENVGKSGEIPAGAFVPDAVMDAAPGSRFRDAGSYYDPSAEGYAQNFVQAQEALAQAGYPDGAGFPTVELLYVEGSVYQAMAESVQHQWEKLGVRVELVQQEWGTFLGSMNGHDFQIASLAWTADYNDPSSFLDLWTTDGGNNFTGWSNAEYDALIREAMMAGDTQTHFAKLHEAEDLLFDEWLLCPIYYYVDAYLQSPALNNLYASVYGTKYFMYADMGNR